MDQEKNCGRYPPTNFFQIYNFFPNLQFFSINFITPHPRKEKKINVGERHDGRKKYECA